MSDIEQRISRLEQRLKQIEMRLGIRSEPLQEKTVVETKPVDDEQSLPGINGYLIDQFLRDRTNLRTDDTDTRSQEKNLQKKPDEISLTATTILGWGGVTALVLAAAYLIILAIDNGWLTPARQVFLAILGSVSLIIAGLALRNSDRQYASLLPACGIVILFLSIYGAHLYYQLIGTTIAAGSVILVCVTSLWLCRIFDSQLYALFAVVGSYSAPFLLPGLRKEILDIVIYYSAWSVLFCVYSIGVGSRLVYLVALFMAMIGFDLIWRETVSDNWVMAVIFQFIQFVIFVSCATYYSVKHNAPMTKDVALAHAPALLIFYLLEYALLERHIPDYAPWCAAGSLALLAIAYGTARVYLKTSLEGGRWLLGAYAALVLFHAGYLESVPDNWAPWAALIIVLVTAIYFQLQKNQGTISWPMGLAIGLIFAANYIRVVLDYDLASVPASELLVILYAAELYAGYYFLGSIESFKSMRAPLIYAGHISAMAAAVHIFNDRFVISLTWGVLALACVILAIKSNDKTLGQSSLVVFAASAIKVFLYDLSGTTPLVRIACLLVLGITFYIGGWLYRKISQLESVT